MAKLKVTEISGRTPTGKAPQLSALNIPINLANYEARAIGNIGKEITQLFADQKAEEDNNEFAEIEKKINLDVLKSFNENSNNTNLSTALENFTNDIDYTNYKDLGSNKAVKKKIKNYLGNVNRKYSLDLGKEVLKKSAALSKANKQNKLDKLIKVLGGVDATAIPLARREYNTFFKDPANVAFYGPEMLQEKKDESDQLINELALINAGRRGEINLFDNEQRKKIIEGLPENKRKVILENIRNSKINLDIEEEQYIAWKNKQTKKHKIDSFSKILVSMNDHRLNPSDETQDQLPDLNQLYDFKESGVINSAQYNTLIKFYASDELTLSDPEIEEFIMAQMAFADVAEEYDLIQEAVNLDEEIQKRLSPKSIIQLNGLLDKYKENRKFAKDDKYFTDLLKTNTKKIADATQGSMFFANPVQNTDYQWFNKANAIMQEYRDLILNENFTPEQAYEEVIVKLGDKNLPKLYTLRQPRSSTIQDFQQQLKDNPKDAFIEMRDKAADAYMSSGNMAQYKDDLTYIDRIEDVFNVTLSVHDGNYEKALKGQFKR